MLTAVIDRVAFPVLCKSDDKEMTQKSHSIFRPIFTLIYPAVAVAIVIVPDFIILFFGEQWRPAGLYCAILLLALFPGLIRIMLRNILKSSGKTKMIFVAEILTVIVTLVLVGIALCFSVLFLVSSMVASMVFSMLVYAWLSDSWQMISPKEIVGLIFIPFIAAVAAALGSCVVLLLCGALSAPIRIMGAGCAGFGVALTFYICVRDEFCLYWLCWCKRKLKSGSNA
jgi:O-antigen/teichoic acid export membrane protein